MLDDCVVVGEAGDGATGVAAALELASDVVLMDLSMPGMSGIDATRRIMAAQPHVGIAVMTMLSTAPSAKPCGREPAATWSKAREPRKILDVLRGVHAGRAVLGAPAGLARRRRARRPIPRTHAARTGNPHPPSGQHVNGRHRRGLGLSDKTVRNHLSWIFTKLQVVDRAAAIVKAREAGLPH